MVSLKRMFRSWMRNKLFVAEVMLILAFGLGANIAIFSVYSAAFLQLPYEDSARIVVLGEANHSTDSDEAFLSVDDFKDWQVSVDAFESTALYDSGSGVITAADGVAPQRLTIATVSGNLFSVLGIHSQVGELFSTSENKEDARTALVSDHLWRTLFSGKPDAVGRNIKIGDDIYVIRGVLPSDFRLFDDADVWVRLQQTADESRGGRHFIGIGRLKKGRSLRQAKAELKVVSDRLQKEYADTNAGWEPFIMPIRDFLSRNLKSSFTLLFIAALLVLLITIFNVTNLFGVYLHSRQKDQALELALGCPVRKIQFRLFGEFILLALIAGALGLAISYITLNLVLQYAPQALTHNRDYLNLHVYAFVFGIALASGLFSTLLSFLWRSEMNISDIIKGSGSALASRLGFRSLPRLFFLIFEVSMCVVLLITAGLLSKSFILLQRVDPGFKTMGLLTAKLELPPSHYQHPQQLLFWDRLLTTLKQLPEIRDVGAMTGVPLSGSRMSFRFTADNHPGSPATTGLVEYRGVSPEVFQLLGIPLRVGRTFSDSDDMQSQPVIIINETMARTVFRGQDPIGKHLTLSYGDKKPREIIGVVGNVKYSGLAEEVKNQVYVPYRQNPWSFMTLIVRTNVPPADVAATLRKEVLNLDKEIPIEDVRTMDEIVYLSMSRGRFATVLIFCFAGLALTLAVSGLYSVISFAVSRRTREIAIRMALGATHYSVMKLFLLQSLAVLAFGTFIGLIISFFCIRLFQAFLYEVRPLDFEVNALVICLIVAVGLLACLFPAGKAARVEPGLAIRSE